MFEEKFQAGVFGPLSENLLERFKDKTYYCSIVSENIRHFNGEDFALEQVELIGVVLDDQIGATMKSRKKQIRDNFRNACLKRDGYRCVMCGFQPENIEELDSHHIIDRHCLPAGGYVKENGIILCTDRSPSSPNCHLKAEHYHITGEALEGFAPSDLFAKIGSSEELARKVAEQLEKEN